MTTSWAIYSHFEPPRGLQQRSSQIVRRSGTTTGFRVLPRRWVVERSLAWIIRHRRCARDYECLPEHHEVTVPWSMIRLTSQRLTRSV
ncbi:transposase [Haloechinothrix sp. YIM 98757]|uniref:Transposase n=1 Tax=Haloechinothrix aidingensis TaxID=2752311 RepID=A0A838AEQ3_9PSEU|nr:transposase [Haloechinothrix aidingensis]